MKRKLLFLLVFAGLLVMDYSCNILDPAANDGTIEVSTSQYTGGCPISVQLDGGTQFPVGAGSLYSFPPSSPGNHTLTIIASSSTSSNCTGTCSINGNGNTNCTVKVSSGKLSIAVLSGSSCDVQLACP